MENEGEIGGQHTNTPKKPVRSTNRSLKQPVAPSWQQLYQPSSFIRSICSRHDSKLVLPTQSRNQTRLLRRHRLQVQWRNVRDPMIIKE